MRTGNVLILGVAAVIFLPFVAICSTAQAKTYYVRPVSGEYGSEDGTNYENAFDGFSDITWGSLGGGDTLFVAGTHSEQLDIQASGTNDTTRLNIYSCTTANGASTDDAGSIDGNGSDPGSLTITFEDYITVKGLTVENSTTTHTNGIYINTGSYLTFDDCTIDNNMRNGIYGYNSISHLTIENSTIQYNDRSGILMGDGGSSDNVIIRWNTFDSNSQLVISNPDGCKSHDTSHSLYHNIYLDTEISDTSEVYENLLINDGCGQGIKLKSSAKVYRNYIANNDESGVMLIGNSDGPSTVNYYVYNNVIVGHWKRGIHYYKESGRQTINITLYNNTIYQPSGCDDCLGTWNGRPSSYICKNNILYHAGGQPCFFSYSSSAPTTSDFDNNWCYTSSKDKCVWDNVGKTWSEWQAMGHDIHGDAADPKFNKSPSDLSLALDSPCIDAGANLGANYDDALNPSASWPDAVSTLDQDDYGSGWEVGAFVFYEGGDIPPLAPTGLKIVQY